MPKFFKTVGAARFDMMAGVAAMLTAFFLCIGGAGTCTPKSPERSTVDPSSEFTYLITAQYAYSAASPIITTENQMLQSLGQIPA